MEDNPLKIIVDKLKHYYKKAIDPLFWASDYEKRSYLILKFVLIYQHGNYNTSKFQNPYYLEKKPGNRN